MTIGSQVENEIAMNALFRAVSLAGGLDQLTDRIRVPKSYLLSYASGATPIPEAVFLRLVDFILEDDSHFAQPLPPEQSPK